MNHSIIQVINPHLDSSGPSTLVRFLPGQAVTVGADLTLAFFFPHDANQAPFPVGNPYSFAIEARLQNTTGSKTITMRYGDQLEVEQVAALLIWPVAFDIDLPSGQVRSVMAHIESTDAAFPLQQQLANIRR